MTAPERLELKLTPEQVEKFRPLWERAQQARTPDCVFAQVLRLDWTQGAHLVLAVSLIPKETAVAMCEAVAALRRKKAERIAKAEAKEVARRAHYAPEASKGQESPVLRESAPIAEAIMT